MTKITRTLALAACSIAMAGAAKSAPTPCGPRAGIVEQLSARHSENQVALGLADTGQVMELWMGPGGSWTLLASLPSGTSCVVAAGEHIGIATITTDQQIIATTSQQTISTRTTPQGVVATPTIEGVIPLATTHLIVA